MPGYDLTFPRLRSRLFFECRRLALSWRAMRQGRGQSVKLKRDGALLRLSDGVRQIAVPHVSFAADYRDGVSARLEAVAEKYTGTTGYAPRDGDVVIDIGAGIGEFTLWCADRGARVVAFEPDPAAFACLGQNTSLSPEVQTYPFALWKERVDLRLHGSLDTRESSLIEDGRANARNADVEAWPLDQLPFMAQLAVIDFMKVDGEGVEPEILAGAARTLRRTRVLAVDIGATDRRPNLRARVEGALEANNFRAVDSGSDDSIMALNTAMVGPFNSRAPGRPDS